MAIYERFEDLPVWQEAARLYNLALDLLQTQKLLLGPGWRLQFERAALSVSNNIAEGFERACRATGGACGFSTFEADVERLPVKLIRRQWILETQRALISNSNFLNGRSTPYKRSRANCPCRVWSCPWVYVAPANDHGQPL